MEIRVLFPGGKRVDAQVGAHRVQTDQPENGGGENFAPAPFELFLASLATCAGYYVLAFCNARNIPTTGIEIVQHDTKDDSGHITTIELDVHLPDEFPEKYRIAVLRAAEGCKVKRLLLDPPSVGIREVRRRAESPADAN